MKEHEAIVRRATMADLDGILQLQAANQPDRGGTLSAALPLTKLIEMMRAMPQIVASRGERVTGFLLSSTRAINADVPVIGAMLAAYPGTAGAYVYGPICVGAEERGQGLAQAMFQELRRLLPAREGLLFIRRDNLASLRAHAKMGMSEVAGFEFDGSEFAVFAYR